MKKSKKSTALVLNGYPEFLGELKQRIATARLNAARTVNRELILLYWDIGQEILERKAELQWGQSVIERLAKDLQKAFPGVSGFSSRNLRDMKRFYAEYSAPEFWRQAVAKLGDQHLLSGPKPIWRPSISDDSPPVLLRGLCDLLFKAIHFEQKLAKSAKVMRRKRLALFNEIVDA